MIVFFSSDNVIFPNLVQVYQRMKSKPREYVYHLIMWPLLVIIDLLSIFVIRMKKIQTTIMIIVFIMMMMMKWKCFLRSNSQIVEAAKQRRLIHLLMCIEYIWSEVMSDEREANYSYITAINNKRKQTSEQASKQ